MAKSERSKGVAVLLALVLGGIGAHRFYMGRILSGLIYIAFCWTFIPAILGLVEGMLIAISSDRSFQARCR